MKKKTVTLGYVVFVTISAMLGAGCDANGEKAMAKAINLFKEGETIEGFKINSIKTANDLPNFVYPPDIIKKCDEELSKIIP